MRENAPPGSNPSAYRASGRDTGNHTQRASVRKITHNRCSCTWAQAAPASARKIAARRIRVSPHHYGAPTVTVPGVMVVSGDGRRRTAPAVRDNHTGRDASPHDRADDQ